jgi:tight adherence protein B
MDLLALGAALSIMVAVVALGLAFASVPASAQARSRLEIALSGAASSVIESGALDPLRVRRKGGFVQNIASGTWLRRLQRDLYLADSQMQPGDFLAIRLASLCLGFALSVLFVPSLALGLLAGVGAGAVGFQVPHFWLKQRQNSRSKKLEEQLPEALTLIANSLKAGFGLMQAIDMAASQLEHPIATELQLTVHETNVGSSMEVAFQALSERNASYDLDLVVTAILVQRTAGGNLSEILETVTETMRERTRIKGEINTLTAQQKLTGIVIALLPVGVGGMFMLVSPSYITVLFTDTLGLVMLGVAGLLEFVGIMIIRRILAIEV